MKDVLAGSGRVTTAATPAVTGRCIPAWPKDALRTGFGIIWLIGATLKWLPGFRSGYMGMIMGQADGQPGWLKGWFTFWVNVQHPQAMFFAYLVAVVETLIALALIAGFARKITYISAATFSVLIWAKAEGFGGPYTSGSADIGTAVIYAVVFAGPARAQLLRRPGPLQRRLLPGEEDLLVVEGRRGSPPRPRAGHGRPGPRADGSCHRRCRPPGQDSRASQASGPSRAGPSLSAPAHHVTGHLTAASDLWRNS